jgi:CheY-like chemotaxis protein
MTAGDQTSIMPTLLLADQSVTIQRVIQLTFADQGIDVVAVSDSDEAIARLAESGADIVLADTGMPGRSGYDLARHVKSTPGLAHIPVLLLAGAFESVDPERVAAAGCDGVLTKPFEPQALIQRVRELLGRDASTRARAREVTAGAVTRVTQPIFGEVLSRDVETPVAEVALDNPAEMSVALQSPPPVVEPAMSATVDHGFEAASPPPPSAPFDQTPLAGGVDDYFDQLDRAISARVSARANRPAVSSAPPAPDPLADSEPAPQPAASAPRQSDHRPMLVDAFSALLAAEESESADPDAAMQSLLPPPAPPAPVIPPTIVVSEEIVEKVVRRVLEEMSGQALRETVAEVTASTAERLILEEIARIKSNIT